MQRALIAAISLTALAACASRQRTESGDLTPQIESEKDRLARVEAEFDTLQLQRESVDRRLGAYEDSLALARQRAAQVAASTPPTVQAETVVATGALAPVTAPEPGGGERALSEEDMRIMSAQIYFATNSAHLNAASRSLLRQKAEILKRNGALTLTLTGHADARGTASYNQRLSERRSEAVKKFLLSSGIEEERLTSEGRGEEEPAEQGSGENVWSRNRRVEFVIA
jgi:peptidoglycan-associated lipoprotein